MGHVQDRWFKSVQDPNDSSKSFRVPTGRHGVGKRYRARVIGPHGNEISESFADGQDKAALDWVSRTEAKITLGLYAAPVKEGGFLLETYGKKWLEELDVDESSREIMEMRFRKNIFPLLGRKVMAEIRASDIRSWDSALRKNKLSDRYRHTLFGNLSALLTAAVDDGLMSVNPCDGKSVKRPKPKKKKVVPWPEDQIWKVRAGLPERFQVLTDLAAGGGLRQGECLGLAVDDIDREGGRLLVRRQVKTVRSRLVFALPKFEKEREVPLPLRLVEALDEHMLRFPPVKATLPWAVPDGKRATAELVVTSMTGLVIRGTEFDRTYWKKALKEAGVPHGPYENGMHNLRHFFASVLLDQGESIKAVAEYLGHADPSFTLETYTHLMPASDKRTKGVIDGVYSRRDDQRRPDDGPEA